jgi:transposase
VLLAGLIWDDPSPREAGTRLTMDGEDDTHRDHHGAQHVYVGGGGTRRVEVISGVDRRRRWGREEKSRIIGESFGEGVNVSEVARRNGVSIGLLHHWRRAARSRAGAVEQSFVPLLPIGGEERAAIAAAPLIEIDMDAGRVRVMGAVDPAMLRAVIASMRGE